MEILKPNIVRCIEVAKSSKNRYGNNFYIANLSGTAKIWIDTKNREKGASKFWEPNELELFLVTWSSHPSKTKCDINQQLYRM